MDTFWGEFVQALLMAFAPILAGLLAAWLVGIVRLVWQRIKVEKPQLGYVLENIAITAVRAAEQSGAAGYIQDKKQYAIQYVQNYLNTQGWGAIDVALIEGAIEAAVWEEFNKDKPESGDDAIGYALPESGDEAE